MELSLLPTRKRVTAAVVASALCAACAVLSVGTANADARETDDNDAACRTAASIYRNVPTRGPRLGDLSEREFSICQPTDDRVRLVSRKPRHDNLGDAWLHVVVTSPYKGRRVGWIVRHNLELLGPCSNASYIPVRPADE